MRKAKAVKLFFERLAVLVKVFLGFKIKCSPYEEPGYKIQIDPKLCVPFPNPL